MRFLEPESCSEKKAVIRLMLQDHHLHRTRKQPSVAVPHQLATSVLCCMYWPALVLMRTELSWWFGSGPENLWWISKLEPQFCGAQPLVRCYESRALLTLYFGQQVGALRHPSSLAHFNAIHLFQHLSFSSSASVFLSFIFKKKSPKKSPGTRQRLPFVLPVFCWPLSICSLSVHSQPPPSLHIYIFPSFI